VLGVVGAYSGGIYGLPEGLTTPSGHICSHRAFCTVSIVRQEYSEGPDNNNMDLRFPPLSPTAALMVVHQDSVCASLDPLDVRLPLILVMPNPGIADSLLINSEHVYSQMPPRFGLKS
jgi:hypothetical protein